NSARLNQKRSHRQEREMTVTTMLPELVLRSPEADWDRARWETLPKDGNRYEVIDGVLYMTTAPRSFHQWIIRQIVFTLAPQIDTPVIGITQSAPTGLCMPGCDRVQADILVVRSTELDMFQDSRIYGIPALLIEVLSPSNPNQDTKVKRGAYARAGVPEYWIVRPADRD